ncbi:MAG: hypothetical protein Q8Q23_04050 [bacterium]|nr:hypothetical protein [bacterium]
MSISALKIRLLLAILLLAVILFLIYKAIVPFGEITYAATPCDQSFFISELKPKDRMAEIDKKNCAQKIIGEPAYFNLTAPRAFDTAEIKITYRVSGDPLSRPPIIELGLQADERKNYLLKPLDNILIDSLTGWDKMTEGGITLLQREKDYNNLSSFLQKLPLKKEIRTYHYDLPPQTAITDYTPSNDFQTINRPLRGAYQFYTYINNETFQFTFDFSDLNRNKDADDIRVLVYHNDLPISDDKLADDRGGEETRQTQELGSLILNIPNLENGFYKVSVIVNDDIVTNSMTTDQKIISFINRLWLHESANTDLIKLYSDVTEVTASTINPASLQKILVNDEILNLTDTYRQFSLPTSRAETQIQFAKDDIIISGSGVFAFFADALFNPDYKKISKATAVDVNGVNYIITSYQPDANHSEWREKTLYFDLKNSFRYENAYGFIISVPGLIADDEADDFVEIKNIEIKLKGKTLIDKIKNII